MKSILFDLDGTLVDSSLGIKNSFADAFDKLALPLPDPETLRTFIGPPLESSFSKYVTEVDNAVNIYREYYREHGVYQVSLYPDIEKLLNELVTAGHKLYITSSKNEAMIHVMLKHLGIESYFTAIYGDTPQRNNKTKVIAACLRQENLNKQDALIIGDTAFDMVGGTNNGIAKLGVTWGFGLEEELLQVGADEICHLPLDILKVLETL